VSFRLAQPVDSSGVLPDGRAFGDVRGLRRLLAGDTRPLLRNLAGRLAVFATGRPLSFSDRDRLEAIVLAAESRGGGVRAMLHELVQSELFQSR
jgi:hypothetical protein